MAAKRAAFWTTLGLAALLASELVAGVGLWLAPRFGWPTRARLRAELADEGADAPDTGERAAGNALHPYVGFVRNPDQPEPLRVNRLVVDDPLNEFGFFGPSPLDGTDGAFRVALTGGSVAEELYLYGRGVLADGLRANGAAAGRPVEIVSAAVAGFKQPQQLFAVGYLLVLGARFDVVVNVDGFNEVVLPFTDNVPGGLAPSFPFRWNTVAADGLDPQTALAVAAVARADERLRGWRRAFDRPGLRDSSLALALWHAVRRRIEDERAAAEVALAERLGAAAGPALRGPGAGIEPGPALFDASVAIWSRSSRALGAVCAARGALYVHVLQPNQYAPGAAPRDGEARRIALAGTRSATRVAAETGYPLLIAEGARLSAAGVRFADLGDLFAGASEPIYRDKCCHYFEPGYRLLAERIAAEIGAAVSRAD